MTSFSMSRTAAISMLEKIKPSHGRKGGPIEGLTKVRIRYDDELFRATFTGDNTELRLEAWDMAFAGTDDADWAVCAFDLMKVLKSSKERRIKFSENAPMLTVTLGKTLHNLVTHDITDLPSAKTHKDDEMDELTVAANHFVDKLKSVKGSIATEEVRYYLCGVCLMTNQGVLDVVATDGHTLRYNCMRDTVGSLRERILPSAAVNSMITAFGGMGGSMRIVSSKYLCEVFYANFKMVFNWIDGTYPQWQRVVPDKIEDGTFSFVAKEMIDGLKQATILKTNKMAKVELSRSIDEIIVVTHENSGSISRAEVEGFYLTDDPQRYLTKSAFNYTHLNDLIKDTGSNIVMCSQEEERDPMIIWPNNDTVSDWYGVITVAPR